MDGALDAEAKERQVGLDTHEFLASLSSIERALEESKWASTPWAIWEKLGRLFFEGREIIDPDAQYGLPRSPVVLSIPCSARRLESERARRDAEQASPRPSFTTYCWAVMGCLDRAATGPALSAYKDVDETLDRAAEALDSGYIYDHRPTQNFFRDSEEKARGVTQPMLQATRETIRFLKQTVQERVHQNSDVANGGAAVTTGPDRKAFSLRLGAEAFQRLAGEFRDLTESLHTKASDAVTELSRIVRMLSAPSEWRHGERPDYGALKQALDIGGHEGVDPASLALVSQHAKVMMRLCGQATALWLEFSDWEGWPRAKMCLTERASADDPAAFWLVAVEELAVDPRSLIPIRSVSLDSLSRASGIALRNEDPGDSLPDPFDPFFFAIVGYDLANCSRHACRYLADVLEHGVEGNEDTGRAGGVSLQQASGSNVTDQGSLAQTEDSDGEGSAVEQLKPSVRRAWDAHCEAIQAQPELEAKPDREVYDWMKEHADTDRESPNFESWARYVREARRILNRQKNTSRSARQHGGSIRRATEI